MKCHTSTVGCVVLLQLTVLCSAWGRAEEHFDHKEQLDQCREVIDCNDPLDVLSSDKRELSTVTSKEDMDRLCPNIKQHLECIDRKTRLCMSPELLIGFNVLYNGTIVVMTELCHNDTYQQEYLKYAPCFNKLKKEEYCETTYSVALEEIQKNKPNSDTVQRICCSFQEYLDCSKHKVGAECGHEAGEFNRKMLDTMTTTLKEQCQQHTVEREKCRAISLASRTPGGAGAPGTQPPLALVVLPALLLALGSLLAP